MPSVAPVLPLLLAAFLSLGVEREVSAPPVIEKRTTFGADAKIAWNGDVRFVVWTDGRTFGSRVSSDGELLDPNGIPLSISARGGSQVVSVEPFEDGFLVTWREDEHHYARHIGRDGSTLRPPLRLPAQAGDHVATNGTTVLFASGDGEEIGVVASHDLREFTTIRIPVDTPRGMLFAVEPVESDYVLFFAPVGRTRSDNVLAVRVRPDGTSELTTIPLLDQFSAAWTGQDFLLAYPLGRWLSTRRLSADLATLSDFEIVVTANEEIASVVAEPGDMPGEAIISWHNRNQAGRVRVRQDGSTELLPATAPPHALVNRRRSLPGEQESFAAVRDGASAAVLFTQEIAESQRQVMFKARPDLPARPVWPSERPQWAAAIASNGQSSLVTWTEPALAPWDADAFALIVDQDGEPLTEPIRLSPRRGLFPWLTAAWTGQMYVVAWASPLEFVRILENGTIIDAEPVRIPPGREHDPQQALTITRIADMTLLMWTEGSAGCEILCPPMDPPRLRAARLTASGTLLDPTGFVIADEAGFAEVASVGSIGLIVWERDGSVLGRRITESGVQLDDTPILIASGTQYAYPSVARHQSGFVVTWRSGARLHATFVNRRGELGGTTDAGIAPSLDWPPLAFTTPSGQAAIAYARDDLTTAFIPRLFWRRFEDTPLRRDRAVRR